MSGFSTAKINSLPDQASGITRLVLRKLTLNTSDPSEMTILAFFLARRELTVYCKAEMCAKMREMAIVCQNSSFK